MGGWDAVVMEEGVGRTLIPPHGEASSGPLSLAERYARQRRATLDLCDGLSAEDMSAQSMPQTSPTKWHLAHTTWFFEQFVLGVRVSADDWARLFNSYYEQVGRPFARDRRGLLTRPSLAEVLAYRARVDDLVLALLDRDLEPERASHVELGIQHEQQHQELLLTDLKHLFAQSPLEPVFRFPPSSGAPAPASLSNGLRLRFLPGTSGPIDIGHEGPGFAFDNEQPRHPAMVARHRIANRPVTNAEYRTFILDGGYRRPELWLSDGWAEVRRAGWDRPLYWSSELDTEFTLHGRVSIDPHAPVCHVSYYEADAFARWAGARLLTEQEWESDADPGDIASGHWRESGVFHPTAAIRDVGVRQMFGDVWEWTSSAYSAYPRFRPAVGAVGEYNGKFMCGQYVLRGGSCASPESHIRSTYRNFFYPADRWQFMGIRLGVDG
ncbi:ergothioneine biosynthesis protein EgtB [Tahibacter amnicola]|uniref:Ergothioneine biosynthesis protein EgtB n=1 Tax=Tahibacter amnicola TaxID=2976241 RepID=A0ABY6BQ04_9GAMM|nr:ergothioneine biosynthesis protein EgtB [Tahibacter amnicola]UXI69852.1 ergothioneine biosynthesis protein EgtB [Tahibacter amnicola]